MIGNAPINPRGPSRLCYVVFPELTYHMFDARNMMCYCDPRNGKYFTSFVQFRGGKWITAKDCDEQIFNFRKRYNSNFIEWNPTKTSLIRITPQGLKITSTIICNSTAIQEVFKRISVQFIEIFRRKEYLHRYTSEGMDELEFIEAESNMNDLIAEYQNYQDVYADDDEGEI